MSLSLAFKRSSYTIAMPSSRGGRSEAQQNNSNLTYLLEPEYQQLQLRCRIARKRAVYFVKITPPQQAATASEGLSVGVDLSRS